MAKIKYFFNPKTLTYEHYKPKIWKRLIQVGGIFSTTLFFAFLLLMVFYYYVDSPKEKQLKREIRYYQHQYGILSNRTAHLQNVISELEDRDDNIYRVIFEAEPIPKSVRSAGFGGVEKYRNFEGYTLSQNLKDVNQKLDRLTKQAYILSKSYDEISGMAINKADMLACIPAIQPVSNRDLNRIASGYGYRIHPIYKSKKLHEGIDFTAPVGTEIYATGNGTVTRAEYDRRGYGNFIIIDHGYGYETLYAHLHKMEVRAGQKVRRGELLGYVGNTGLSTAPHLHYEVIKNGRKINPINFFYNDLSPEEYEKVLELASRPNQSFD